ncbi:hypothetical protein PRIPAC_80620, partial [Pristionchus pacificus]
LIKMYQSMILLSLLFLPISAIFIPIPPVHYSDILKVKCEALPFRSMYMDRICYFVIDFYLDAAETSEQCSRVLTGARLAPSAPEQVWNYVYANKNECLMEGGSVPKKRAMCMLENRFPQSTAVAAPGPAYISGDQELSARMHTPFRKDFVEAVEPGQTIILKGFITSSAIGFHINLQAGGLNTAETRDSGGNIPFHMGFGLNDGKVILGTLSKGKWNKGETKTHPLRKNAPFDIRIRVHAERFQVFINDKEMYNYKMVIPISSISHLYIYTNEKESYLTYGHLGEKTNPVPQPSGLLTSSDSATSSQGQAIIATKTQTPVSAPFPKKIVTGQALILKGFITTSAINFHINLQVGGLSTNKSRYSGGSIPFHMGFNLHTGKVIFGTLTNGNWNTGEYKSHSLKKDKYFDIRIRFLADRFQVFVNQKEIGNYKHRLPLEQIDNLYVYTNEHTSYLTSAFLEDRFSSDAISTSFSNGFPVCGEQSCAALRSKYTSRIPIEDCKSLLITGSAKEQSFSIKLISKNGDVALLFSPRFDKKNAVLNSFKNNKWLTEETVSALPIEKNTRFEVSITNEANAFQIFVNGSHFATFDHRMCPYDVNLLDIEGVFDLDIQVK